MLFRNDATIAFLLAMGIGCAILVALEFRRNRKRTATVLLVVGTMILLFITPLFFLWPTIRIHRLISTLSESDPSRRNAIFELREIGSPATGALLKAMESKDSKTRHGAASVLSRVGGVKDELITLMKHDHPGTRSAAASALGDIRPSSPEAVRALAKALKDQESEVRRQASHSLGSLGGEAAATVPDLIQGLKDSDNSVRASHARALGQIGLRPEEAIPQLLMLLSDSSSKVRKAAATSLGSTGYGNATVPALLKARESDDPRVREAVEWALKGFRGPSTDEKIKELIRASDKALSHR